MKHLSSKSTNNTLDVSQAHSNIDERTELSVKWIKYNSKVQFLRKIPIKFDAQYPAAFLPLLLTKHDATQRNTFFKTNKTLFDVVWIDARQTKTQKRYDVQATFRIVLRVAEHRTSDRNAALETGDQTVWLRQRLKRRIRSVAAFKIHNHCIRILSSQTLNVALQHLSPKNT